MAVLELFPAGSVRFSDGFSHTMVTSSNFTVGYQFDAVSNVTNKDLDHIVTGQVGTGLSPTANTQFQLWIVPCQTDNLSGTVTWPDTFTATKGTVTVTSAGILQGCGRLGQSINNDTSVSSSGYNVQFSVASLFGGSLPSQYVTFVTHNTGVDGQTFDFFYLRIQGSVS